MGEVPWFAVRLSCYCGRYHAPWWNTTPPPSCKTVKESDAQADQ